MNPWTRCLILLFCIIVTTAKSTDDLPNVNGKKVDKAEKILKEANPSLNVERAKPGAIVNEHSHTDRAVLFFDPRTNRVERTEHG